MAGTKRPSFLKRQKEQKRMARAAEKRESKRLKKRAGTRMDDSGEPDAAANDLEGVEGVPGIDDAEPSDANDPE